MSNGTPDLCLVTFATVEYVAPIPNPALRGLRVHAEHRGVERHDISGEVVDVERAGVHVGSLVPVIVLAARATGNR